jgi:ABC-2 type transport system permease protein
MFTEAKKILKIFRRYFKLNLSSQMEYRVSFIVQVFGMVLNNAAFIVFWGVLFAKMGGSIAGYEMRDVMFLWAVASSAFGFFDILFYNSVRISHLIITGELDTFLLQPLPVLANILGSATQASGWGDFIYGWVLFLIFWGLNIKAILVFVLAIFIGGLVMTGIQVMVHAITFFIGNADMLTSSAFNFMISFSIYPEGIFSGVIRAIIYSILPAAFISHIPLSLVMNFNIGTLVIWLSGAALYCTLAVLFFYRGLRKYESGNLIITRM